MAVGSALTIFVACSGDRPQAGASSSSSAPSNAVCLTPNDGCPCEGDAPVACGVEARGDHNFIFCEQGTRTCNGGTWGACQTNGQVSVSTRAAATSGLHTMSLGSPVLCTAYGSDGGLNPCDPNCSVTNDTPAGFDAGAAFTLVDGGLVVQGCGDGVKKVGEECDDGNTTSGDGCSNRCVIELGYQCPTPGMACSLTTCGNGLLEGAEQCDDGNLRAYDGCSPLCQKEANCPGGLCLAVCGDGLRFPAEACDDGNTVNGDGCSSTCTIESGATCTVVTTGLPATITVPLVFHDFTPSTSNDFENYNAGLKTGIVQSTLDAFNKPVFKASQSCVTSAATFYQWYHDSTASKVVLGSIVLTKQPDDSYVYDSNHSFFPLDGLGYGNYASTGHNFHFTSELHYPFTFAGGESFTFNGDDDVFVFINGRLAVDLGGVHGETGGSLTLNAANAAALGLVVGNTYEIAIFQAERHTTGSNYKLTLRGFVRERSYCGVPSSLTITRDFEATCAPGFNPTWQLFRWRAANPTGSFIDFRASTADTQAALPSVPLGAPVSVSIGSATSTNSPVVTPTTWMSDRSTVSPFDPVPVSAHLKSEANQLSQRWLRVFMSFNPSNGKSPRLDEWQQLYDCVPSE